MHDAHEFLKALTVVLCVAALTTVVFQRLRQPVVLGYLIAGLIVGPHVPIPLVADVGIVQTLSEVGVILLMFSLGLEFSLRKLLRVGPTSGVTAVVQCSLMVWLGFLTGRAFGWTGQESLFCGAAIAISSTTIIAKAFDEQKIVGRLREVVVGILIVEDLIAILLMAFLTAMSSGRGMSAGDVAVTTGRLMAFLVGLVVVGILLVPRTVRWIVKLDRPETTLVASIGFCFGVALLAQQFGYSVALGAFLAGSLVAESGEEKKIEHLVEPVRDVFAAIFFVSVGMLIDPALVARHWPEIAVLTAVVVVGKIVSVSLGAFLTGNGPRTSVQAGMSLAQIGEFSFIIAALGLALGATRDFLYPVAVAVSAITTLLTPWLIRASGPAASWVDRKSPRDVQTFAALYGTWIEKLGTAPRKRTTRAAVRRLVGLLLLDAVMIGAVVVTVSVWVDATTSYVEERLGLSGAWALALVIALSAVFCFPFALGIVRVARRLGTTLGDVAFPPPVEGPDRAAAPRRALVVTLQLLSVVLVAAPLLAVTQPFVPGLPAAAAILLLGALLGVAFWRSASNLQGHVRAGAQVIVEVLAAQSHSTAPGGGAPTLDAAQPLLSGLGGPTPVRLAPDSPAVGRTLSELDFRGITGATVLAISRGDRSVHSPTARERLEAGDVLALAGTAEAVESARRLLAGPGGAA